MMKDARWLLIFDDGRRRVEAFGEADPPEAFTPSMGPADMHDRERAYWSRRTYNTTVRVASYGRIEEAQP